MQMNANAKQIVLYISVNFIADRYPVVLYIQYFSRGHIGSEQSVNDQFDTQKVRKSCLNFRGTASSSRLTIPGYTLTGITGADERRDAFKD